MWFILKPLLRHPLMPLLVILQVALACAIATNALFLLQQKLAPILAPEGVADPSHLLVLSNIYVQGAPLAVAELSTVVAGLRTVPGVEQATYSAAFPMVGTMLMEANVLGKDSHTKASAVMYVGNNLVDTLGLRLVAGRNFTPDEEAVTPSSNMVFRANGPVIVTRALADRLYPDGHALGKTLHYANSPDGSRTIVGIVAHLMRNRFTQRPQELDYTLLFPGWVRQFPIAIFAVRTSGFNVMRTCRTLESVIQHNVGDRLVPGSEVQCDTYASLRDQMLAQPRAAVWLLAGVTLIVLIVTLTGIAGMTGYWVQQRIHSIGIRRALGAKRSDVLRELLIEDLIVVGVGVIVGLIVAYGINLWLIRHYELLRLPWTYLPLGAALLLVLGQLAVLVPARRASNIPPMVATRAV